MYHFFVSAEQISDGRALVLGNDVNHIKNVLRMKPGEEIGVNDGDRSFHCRILSLEADRVEAEILEEEKDHELPSRIVLFQGLPKADKLEAIIQKSVELGVYQIVPVEMKRSIVKIDEKKQESRVKRWQAIAESAAKQAGRSRIPEVTGVLNWKKALEKAVKLDHLLVPYEKALGMEETRRLLSSVCPGQSVGIFIGPEGGFEEEEIRMLQAAGAETITLGKRILRTETAGPAVLAMLVYCLEQ